MPFGLGLINHQAAGSFRGLCSIPKLVNSSKAGN